MTSRFAIAKDHLLRSLDSVVPELFGGRGFTAKYPGRWAVVNKHRGDAKIGQMSVWRSPGRKGAWKDYVSGEHGDAIDLVAFALKGIVTADSRMAALEWIEDHFHIKNMSPEQKAKLEEEARVNQAKAEAADKQRAGADRERVRKFFFGSQAQVLGTPAETYLRSRGIDLNAVPHLSTAFRFRPDCAYWMGTPRDGEGNKIGRAPEFPALISAMVSGDGHLCACHYTFLEPDGSSKLKTRARGYLDKDGDPQSAKLMFPSSQGLSIPVTYGPSGLMVREAAAAGKLSWVGVTEGIEDALSVAVAENRLRMHAAGSLAHLGALSDCPAARGYLVFRDNDWAKPQAVEAFDRAIARLKTFGKPVQIAETPKAWGKDVNDALNHED